METLTFPSYEFKIKNVNGRQQIFDALRRKFVALTPEEWVRQHVIRYLIEEKGFPPLLIAVEQQIEINGLKRRCDVICYNSKKEVLMIVECKAPEVKVTQEVFDQVVRYHYELKSKSILVTNGLKNYFALLSEKEIVFLENVAGFSYF
jgi:hypothetical protein